MNFHGLLGGLDYNNDRKYYAHIIRIADIKIIGHNTEQSTVHGNTGLVVRK